MEKFNDSISAVIAAGAKSYQTKLAAGNHIFLADEPLSVGGLDSGPSPGDFLRASLASCTAITLRMYAIRKGWDVGTIEVDVRTEKVNNKTVFYTKLKFSGPVSDEQLKRLHHIANVCPVHKILTNPVEVLTEIE